MKNKKPLVNVNILTFNGQKYIRSCLESVLRQSYANYQVLVVDNASTDNTKELLKAYEGKPRVKIVYNKENYGFCKGHNQALEMTSGEFILCLNQDVILEEEYIEKAIDIFYKYNRASAVQGKLLRWVRGLTMNKAGEEYGVTHIIDTTGLVILKNGRVISRNQGQIDDGSNNQVEEIFGADGAAPVYRRSALNDIKLMGEYMDEDFWAYKDDVDISWRFRLNGWDIYYQPESIGWHDRTAGDSVALSYWAIIKERRKLSPLGKFLGFRNQRLMQIKNELGWHAIKRLPWLLPKEIASWFFVLVFERYTWKAIRDLFKLMPRAFKKRKLIMAKKRISPKQIARWFV